MAHRSYESILNEVGNAVDYVRAQGGAIPDVSVNEQTANGSLFHQLPDNAPVYTYFHRELQPCPPHTVRAANAEELIMAYQALGYIHGGISQQRVTSDIEHEVGHKMRADAIGYEYSGFALSILSSVVRRKIFSVEVGFTWRPSAEQAGPSPRLTKLAYGAIVAGPYSSQGDTACLEAMGYRGRDDVAWRIMASTRSSDGELPLPEGFRR